ncbi:MAG TPA: carboxypeptidase regulatory-like domain-containing protein [Terriglobia bacterium]|nr:carboxypeptidase regulatory-like domain-containing protein [Terriglobia bacterium]
MLRSLVVALLIAGTVATPVHAQLVNGSLRGIATDPQGAAIPDVVVTMTNQETGVAKSVNTREDGSYRLSGVEPGTYSIEFKREGFQTVVVDKIVITTAKESQVNAPMVVGTLATRISVEVPGMELDKSSPNIRLNLPAQILDETPMHTSSLVPAGSRNQLRYALMSPAVARVPGQNETSTNGHRGRENNYLTDGVENNDNSVTLPAIFIPPEAIREFQVQVATFSAEFGHSMGAQVNVTTRSGTNQFHGDIWDFSRSSALEPLSFQNYKANLKKTPRLSAHQFGADLGGPIVAGKTFFFGIVQGNIQRQAALSLSGVTIPTPAGYNALLTAPLRPASAVPAQSPESRQEVLNTLSFLPDFYSEMSGFSSTSPNSYFVNGVPIETGQFVPLIPQNQDIWYAGGRIDHQLGQDTLSYRVHIDHRNKPLGASSSNRAFGERWAADDLGFGQSHAINFTKIVNSHWINEARVAYTRLRAAFPERDPVSPTIKISAPAFTIGGNENFPQDRLEQTYQFQNVSSYIAGRHTLKVGFDLARTGLDNNNAPNSKGTWVFPTLESFMNSQPQSLTQLVVANSRFSFHELRQAYFFQDDIKVTRTLTANLGVRYELGSVPLGFFGATSQQELDAMVPAPVKRDTNNWAPRIGFAYSPEFEGGVLGKLFGMGRSSIRGGFGMAYDVLFYNLLSNPAANYPRNLPNATTAASQLVDVFPAMPPGQPTTPTLSITTAFVNLPTETQKPTSHYWTLSIQRQLNQHYILEVGYTGNRSYHLLRQSQGNPGILDPAKAAYVRNNCTFATLSTCQDPAGFPLSPSGSTTTNSGRMDPRWASRALLEATGRAEYHAAYLRLEKRFSNGLQFGANYTWSANLSDSEDILIGDSLLVGSSPANPQDFLNRRNEWSRSVLDRPHRFSAHYSYQIPGFTQSHAILRHTLSGWQVSGFTELQSGQPFTIRVGVDTIGNGLSNAAAAGRPNYNPGGTITLDPDTGNLRTFKIPLDGTGIIDAPHVTSPAGAITFLRNSMEVGGTMGRNTWRGPGLANTNLSLMKRFVLPNDFRLQIRGDFINVFNHHSFANPDSNMTSSTFGQQILTPVVDSRQVVLGAKLSF